MRISQPGEREDGKCAISFDYHEDLVNLARGLPNRSYVKSEKVWTVPAGDLEDVKDYVQRSGVHVIVSGIDQGLLKEMRDKVPALCSEELEDRLRIVPHETWGRLFPFQRDGVVFGIKRKGRILLADEPGLGKTVQAILIAAAFSDNWPLLIACPTALRKVWQNHFTDWLPQKLLSSNNIRNISSGKDVQAFQQEVNATGRVRQDQITIVSYDMASQMEDLCLKHKFLIIDESHAVKSHNTLRTRFLKKVAQHSEHRILISGTPSQGKPIELYSQLSMVRPGLLGSRDDYGRRYCGGVKKQLGMGHSDYVGASNEKELNAILIDTIMIRRLKKEVLKELPDKIRCSVPVEVNRPHQQELADQRRKMAGNDADRSLSDLERQGLGQQLINELRLKTGQAKAEGSIRHFMDLLEAGHKVIIFAHHRDILEHIHSAVQKTDKQFIRIDGSTPAQSRQALCDRFQSDAKVRAALLSITATGVGITLTAAEVVVFAELDWDPTKLEQAEDRAHRLGQTKALQVHYMVAADPNSADGIMWGTLRKKLGIVGRTVDGHFNGSAAGLKMSAYNPIGDATPADPSPGEAGPSTPAEAPATQANTFSSQDDSQRTVKACQEMVAPGAPTKKKRKRRAPVFDISDSDTDGNIDARDNTPKSGGRDHVDLTVNGFVNDRLFTAKRARRCDEEEVIDLTQESGHPRRTIQFSQEEQGVLASSDED